MSRMEESELEERSFENMVLFYLEELIAIDNGTKTEKVLTIGIARKMRGYDMFSRKPQKSQHGKNNRGYDTCLSQKARQVIKKLHGN